MIVGAFPPQCYEPSCRHAALSHPHLSLCHSIELRLSSLIRIASTAFPPSSNRSDGGLALTSQGAAVTSRILPQLWDFFPAL